MNNITEKYLQNWVSRLSKKIQKSGYKAQQASGSDGAKVSPR